MIVYFISMHIHRQSIHSLVCPPIILSVCPLFCPSGYPSIHPYICNHIVKIAKSIAKSSEINMKSMVHLENEKNIEKKIALKSRIVVRTNLFYITICEIKGFHHLLTLNISSLLLTIFFFFC